MRAPDLRWLTGLGTHAAGYRKVGATGAASSGMQVLTISGWPRRLLMAGALVASLAVARPLSGLTGSGNGVQVLDPTGHWQFTRELPATGRGRGGGGGRGGGPASETVDLILRLAPGGVVTGTLGARAGRHDGAPGTNPLRPVEVSDGRIEGDRLSFSAWQFDRHRNRVQYEGTLRGDRIVLTVTRDTPDGVERIEVEARRVRF